MPPRREPRSAYDPWRDVDGTHIPEMCRIKLVAVDTDHGAMAGRLGKEGVVVARGRNRLLYVWFDSDSASSAIRPHLVRVVPDPSS